MRGLSESCCRTSCLGLDCQDKSNNQSEINNTLSSKKALFGGHFTLGEPHGKPVLAQL